MANDATPHRQPLLTVPQVAELLQVSDKTVRELIRWERIPSLKVGHQRRFDPQALDRWIAAGGSITSRSAHSPSRDAVRQ